MSGGFNPSWVRLLPPRTLKGIGGTPPVSAADPIAQRPTTQYIYGGPRVVVILHPPQAKPMEYEMAVTDRSMCVEDMVAPSLYFATPPPPAANQHPRNVPPVPSIPYKDVSRAAFQAPPRIGGKTTTGWPSPTIVWPEYGNPFNQ